MKKILLFILIIIVILFSLDIIYIYSSTKKALIPVKTNNTNNLEKDIFKISNIDIEENITVDTWFKKMTEGKILILKDIVTVNKKIYIIGQNEKINQNIIIISFNEEGDILFQKEINISSNVKINTAEYINNEFYIVGTQDYKPVIYIVNNSGILIKSKVFNNKGEFIKIIKDNFENIYVTGFIIEKNKRTGYLTEINENLDKLNEFKITWYNDEVITDINYDKNYIYLLGNTNSTANNNENIFIIKLNKLNYSDYTILKYGKEQLNEYGNTILKDNEFYYIIGYSTTINGFPWKVLIIKTDKDFNKIWRKDYLLKKSARGLSANIINKKIIISGYTLEKNDDFDGFILLLNKDDGIIIKENYYGETFDERILKTILFDDKALISVGYQKNPNDILGIILYSDINGGLNGFIK
ncbi:hypothetical protein [Marinitoga sp. 1155]|uniref:hypothetical protein n=1 Tax=Marinitoga sp. 1155 TaxID=1428448 RepID=UPI0006413BE6|nr:hypothetical protein [Marinitoga sp. 1155]KLO23171.1 hypothetical protein X274_06975 [Marinitoga sp. 1155]